jgi:RecA-family ATPase
MNMHRPSLDVRSVAAALGGDVTGPDSVLAPGPGHSPKDRSLSVKLAPDAPDGFTVYSHANDDWKICRDYVAAKLGRASWQPKPRAGNGRRVGEYVYQSEEGTPYLKVIRLRDPKSFPQEHWTGSGWAKGKPKGPKVPYRLPGLLASPQAPLLIVEGEKDADNLHRLGLVATTSSEGAGKWTADLNRWFTGRTVYILPDNDDSGRAHARQVAENLHGIAAEVRVVPLPGLPEKGDVSDWIAADGDVEELLRLCEAAPVWKADDAEEEKPSRTSCFFRASELHGKPVPAREWLVPDLIPHRTVTLFSGDGGTGKSLLALQLAVAAATEGRWIGREVTAGSVLYLSAEDDTDELHRRLSDILASEHADFRDLDRLTIRSLAGEDALLAVETAVNLATTTLYQELEAAAAAQRDVRVIVLDTLADLYPANENDRAKVRQFVGLLRGLSIRQSCAVVLLSHPSLSGLTSGAGTSGSTAWNNSVRSRLYLERIADGAHEPDPDKRRLRTMKANYGQVGGEIGLTWRRGVFVPDEPATGLDRMAAGAKAERVFLKLLDEWSAQGRHVSASPGVSYAPTVFAGLPKAEGMTKHALRGAMEALFSRGELTLGEHGRGVNARKHIERARGGSHAG